jgi:type III pantothenate kinase
MTPDVVVDIGNTRMKWGVCRGGRVAEVLRLPLGEPAVWDATLANLPPPQTPVRKWAVASVNPPALHRFVPWASPHGGGTVFSDHTSLPIRVDVDEPDKVGLDRLFGAIAARAMVPPGTPAITVDVGTAVTVNLIDADGVFQGGAIFPGPRLMGRALHDFTANLPLIDLTEALSGTDLGKNTADAIRRGVAAALIGGVMHLVDGLAAECRVPPRVFVTGGGGHLLGVARVCGLPEPQTVPALNLEGIRLAAEALP